MHEGQHIRDILHTARITDEEMAGAWNELFPHWQATNNLTIRWIKREWTLTPETRVRVDQCIKHILERRQVKLIDLMAEWDKNAGP